MKKLSIALCDDDAGFRSLLRSAITEAFRDSGFEAGIFEASSADELSAALDRVSPDLLFLDIDMPGTDGIRFGEQLRARNCRGDIIYISNMDEKVYDIFHVHPWSFIRKSRLSDELPAVVGEYLRARREHADKLLLTGSGGETVSIDPGELVYVEASGKTQKLILSDPGETVSVRAPLYELEALLLPFGFIRIHKGFLVNYLYIRKITSRSVLLDTGGDLPVGRDRLGPARERYLSLMKWKGLSRPAE